MFAHGELVSLYKTNFMMMHNFGYSLKELEDMIPFEREIYTILLVKHLEKEKENLSKQQR